ncbi:hypothetical protein [Phenylobacterium sp.]|uniref:hypothetical protein n=1 Tax=Phenylobacterium sp. TaxID=1871053 RepID=UPI0025DBF44A|nr:hypothetical protein [Phenylobacterium sp.]
MLAGAAGAATAQTVVVQERWGHWDPTWGREPGPPQHRYMRHWRGHENNYYGHVHNCMVKYHGYNPRRDMYREHRRWVPCRD